MRRRWPKIKRISIWFHCEAREPSRPRLFRRRETEQALRTEAPPARHGLIGAAKVRLSPPQRGRNIPTRATSSAGGEVMEGQGRGGVRTCTHARLFGAQTRFAHLGGLPPQRQWRRCPNYRLRFDIFRSKAVRPETGRRSFNQPGGPAVWGSAHLLPVLVELQHVLDLNAGAGSCLDGRLRGEERRGRVPVSRQRRSQPAARPP